MRTETSKAHANLDAALVKYDLTTRSGLSNYLNVHLLARHFLAENQSAYGTEIDHAESLSAIRSDLETLGVKAQKEIDWTPITAFHPIGLTYVIAGSSLGSKILYKEWAQSNDEAVIRAGKYMTAAKDGSDWSNFLTYIDATDFSANETDHIVVSANECFALYQAAVYHVNRAVS
ncbi:MAG: biliverdin-producing heme oxygenase [Litorimonas sp.]